MHWGVCHCHMQHCTPKELTQDAEGFSEILKIAKIANVHSSGVNTDG